MRLVLLSLLLALILARRNKFKHGHTNSRGEKSNIAFSPIFATSSLAPLCRSESVESEVVVFVHAAVGIFHKKRGNGTWGYGEEILKELLLSVRDSGLLEVVSHVYVGLLGHESDRASAKAFVNAYHPKAQVVMEADNLYFAEFPTLYVKCVLSHESLSK